MRWAVQTHRAVTYNIEVLRTDSENEISFTVEGNLPGGSIIACPMEGESVGWVEVFLSGLKCQFDGDEKR